MAARVLTSAQCDKPAHAPGKEDPCSECRWFNGGGPDCVAVDRSRNDEIWAVMMKRKNYGFALDAHIDRTAAPKPTTKKLTTADGRKVFEKQARPAPTPMVVGDDWKGMTKDALLEKPDWIPAEVRAHPRAYLEPPAPSKTQQRNKEGREKAKLGLFDKGGPSPQQSTEPSRKRKHEDGMTLLRRQPPAFPRPPPDQAEGRALYSAWDWDRSVWVDTYASGFRTEVGVPASGAEFAANLPNRPAGARHTPAQSSARNAREPVEKRQRLAGSTNAPTQPPSTTPMVPADVMDVHEHNQGFPDPGMLGGGEDDAAEFNDDAADFENDAVDDDAIVDDAADFDGDAVDD